MKREKKYNLFHSCKSAVKLEKSVRSSCGRADSLMDSHTRVQDLAGMVHFLPNF